MCEPTTVMIGLSALSIAMTAYAANEQKKATNAAAAVQQQQINDQASAETDNRIREAREARARARVGAAESGVMGGSVDALMSDILFQSGRDVSLIEKNRKNGAMASETERLGRNRVTNAEAAGRIVNTVTSSYNSYQGIQANNARKIGD